ncbi:MAG: D-amino-acid transaminase [Acidobacteriota bacterium]
MKELAYIEGQFVSLSEAKVSVTDRGFVFADGVYEVIAIYRGRAFRLEEHLVRLSNSANAIQLALPIDQSELTTIIETGLEKSGIQEAQVYVQVTRGTAPRVHAFPTQIESNLVVTFRTLHPVPEDIRKKGISVITAEEIRWSRCDIKSIALLPNVLARQKAVEAGAFEAIWMTEEGIVYEGAASNLFVVHDRQLRTPEKSGKILSGITREVVLQCARALDIPATETTVRIADMLQAEEVFLTSTTMAVLGVVEVDGKTIGTGTVGPITQKLNEALDQEVNR